MIVTGTIEQVRRLRSDYGQQLVGFVPTMGYLHEGHLALAQRAVDETNLVMLSIFVNPTQFAPNEDLAHYPRALERDIELAEQAGVDLVFVPDSETMYPPGFQTAVTVNEVTQTLEGAIRPTHFAGVATVVAKLFNIVQPTHAYFGQKDAQQTVVVRRMVKDLNMPVEIVICPTVREEDGLAMSSRNKFLNAEERKSAPVLYRSLLTVQELWRAGERDADSLRAAMDQTLSEEPLATVDYTSIADPEKLDELSGAIDPDKGALASLAVRFGATRLIDNLLLTNTATKD